MIELLESRVLLAASIRFAVIGDYGSGTSDEAAVAARVARWNPNLVITVGDNNYAQATFDDLDNNIGQYYHDFIYPYAGTFGQGSPDGVNRFFPSPGNHDWSTGSLQAYTDYFALPGNERYYTFTQGPVQFFAIDADPNEPDLGYVNATTFTARSREGRWLKSALAGSTAQWKIVYFHQAPFSSGRNHGSSPYMQWPFEAWGADAVFSGHDHDYERIIHKGFAYFVTGPGDADELAEAGFPATGTATPGTTVWTLTRCQKRMPQIPQTSAESIWTPSGEAVQERRWKDGRTRRETRGRKRENVNTAHQVSLRKKIASSRLAE